MADEKCAECDERATELVIAAEGKKVHYCAKHYVEHEGGGCLEGDLLFMEAGEEYDWSEDVVKEIIKQFPKLAEKYKDVIDKILKSKN